MNSVFDNRGSIVNVRRRRWLMRCSGVLAASMIAAFTWFFFDNNYRGSKKSSEEFKTDLDQALDLGVGWIVNKRAVLEKGTANSALLHMLHEMRNPVAYPEIGKIVDVHLQNRSKRDFWRLLIDEKAETGSLYLQPLSKYDEFQRWLAYAVNPERIRLSEEDQGGLLSPDGNRSRDLTHQLFALNILRAREHGDEELDELIDKLCERIAADIALDFRVTDLYLQRVAFVLAAGRHDLIKRRWIERILENQNGDGGYHFSWNGWGPHPLHLFDARKPLAHPTVQGVWVLYMVKHRFPEWIDQNYPATGSAEELVAVRKENRSPEGLR